METKQNATTQDPLGLKRFALTESAYDLINSLIGIYSRLVDRESEQAKPAIDLLKNWHERILELSAIYYEEDWTDLPPIQNLITKLSGEYKQATHLETVVSNSEDYNAHTKSRTLSTSEGTKSADF